MENTLMTNNVKCAGQIKGFPLVKIKSHEMIEKIRAGSFYMNSLKVYRDMYKDCKDNVVGDPYEGKLIVHDAALHIPECAITKALNDYIFPTVNENDFVFCMFGVNPNRYCSFNFTEEQKQKLLGFDDTALVITDSDEFIRRIENAAVAKNLKITHRFVNYYDKKADDVWRFISLLYGTENIVFHKIEEYSYQQEYRFTIQNYTNADFLELDIGDISDITTELTTKEFLNIHMRKE